MRTFRGNRPSSTDSKKGWGCAYLFGCVFVSFASVFMIGVMLSMIPQVRQFTRQQIRKLLGRSVERVTIPEGWNRYQVAARLENRGVVADADAFLAASEDPDLLAAFEIDAESVEGYLFPDTYEFYRGSEPDEVLDVMMSNFMYKWEKLKNKKVNLRSYLISLTK